VIDGRVVLDVEVDVEVDVLLDVVRLVEVDVLLEVVRLVDVLVDVVRLVEVELLVGTTVLVVVVVPQAGHVVVIRSCGLPVAASVELYLTELVDEVQRRGLSERHVGVATPEAERIVGERRALRGENKDEKCQNEAHSSRGTRRPMLVRHVLLPLPTGPPASRLEGES
jgi:hypothetical protein